MATFDKTTIPKIFWSINSGSSEDIVEQILEDESSPERVLLGLEELAKRGELEFLRGLAKSQKARYAKVAQLLLKKPANKGLMEDMLGIKRYQDPIDPSALLDGLSIARVHKLAKVRGYTDTSTPADFLRDHNKRFERYSLDKLASQMPQHTGTIGQEVINISPTFGSLEPIYLEAHHPAEFLNWRSLDSPTFLVLGSVAQYQALEFHDYVKKVNPNGKPVVMEIDLRSLEAVARHSGQRKVVLVNGDAFNHPIRRDSLDAAYTNQIFRSLTLGSREGEEMIAVYDDANAAAVFDRMKRVFEFVHYCLKPGSKFVVIEPQGQKILPPPLKSLAEQGIIKAAVQAGFQVKNLDRNFEYLFRPEVSSAIIDANGFPQYGNAALLKSSKEYLVMVCQKPN